MDATPMGHCNTLTARSAETVRRQYRAAQASAARAAAESSNPTRTVGLVIVALLLNAALREARSAGCTLRCRARTEHGPCANVRSMYGQLIETCLAGDNR